MIAGIDLSLNHGAATILTPNGKFEAVRFFTNIAGSAKKAPEPIGRRLVLPKSDERQQLQMARLAWVKEWLESVLDEFKPTHVGLEDYALDAKHGSHYQGEVGGVARMLLWQRGVYFRLTDPISAKMFATHDGTAQKDLVERCVKERWDLDFSKYNGDPPKKGKPNRCTSEDCADSTAIAKLLHLELDLRAGLVAMKTLHAKEIQCFNRITKSYPVSLLGREFIRNIDGSYNSADYVVKRVRRARDRFRRKQPRSAVVVLCDNFLGET